MFNKSKGKLKDQRDSSNLMSIWKSRNKIQSPLFDLFSLLRGLLNTEYIISSDLAFQRTQNELLGCKGLRTI